MRALLVISGGMDSATMLYHQLKTASYEVDAVSFNYGQRHAKELNYAEVLCHQLGVMHHIINLVDTGMMLSGSALTDYTVEVPEGHYEDESMKATVVPNRNAIMLSIAWGIAVSRGANRVGAAMHAGDHAVYPDCRPEFTSAFESTMKIATQGFGRADLRLWTPFIDKTKTEIAELGAELGVPWHKTWSCYKGEEWHCGACGTCMERREAFRDAGVNDPTHYQKEPSLA